VQLPDFGGPGLGDLGIKHKINNPLTPALAAQVQVSPNPGKITYFG
jgi:hypothetical protein